jgi:hypothetical protein
METTHVPHTLKMRQEKPEEKVIVPKLAPPVIQAKVEHKVIV